MRRYGRLAVALGAFMGAGLLAIAALISGGYFYVAPGLPQAEELRDVRVQIPLSVYSRDGRLISQFGERRTPVDLEDMPSVIVEAVLAMGLYDALAHFLADELGSTDDHASS